MLAQLRDWRDAWRARWRELSDAGADEPLRGPRRWLVWSLSAWDEVRRNNLTVHASALAFWWLLSIVPTLALLFAVLKAFGLLETSRPYLLNVLAAGRGDLADWIALAVERAQGTALGGAGVLGLLAVGFGVLERIKQALNNIWNVTVRPGYASRVIEYVTVLALAPFLALLPVMASALLRSPEVDAWLFSWTGDSAWRVMAAESAGYPIYWILLFYAYAYLPDTRVAWRAAGLGAVVAGTLLNAGQTLYLRSVFELTGYNVIYGALALLPFLMLWLFLAAVIFLFGAQLAYVSQHHAFLVGRRRMGGQPPMARAVLALRALVALLAEFREGSGPVTLHAWARRMGALAREPGPAMPDSTMQAIAAELRRAGLVAAVDGSPQQFVPAQPLAPVTVGEVMRRAGAVPVFASQQEADGLRAVLREADAVLVESLDAATLETLLPDSARRR